MGFMGHDRGVVLQQPGEVRDAWREGYRRPAGRRVERYTHLHRAGLEEVLRRAMDENAEPSRMLLAWYSAARWLAPFARTGTEQRTKSNQERRVKTLSTMFAASTLLFAGCVTQQATRPPSTMEREVLEAFFDKAEKFFEECEPVLQGFEELITKLEPYLDDLAAMEDQFADTEFEDRFLESAEQLGECTKRQLALVDEEQETFGKVLEDGIQINDSDDPLQPRLRAYTQKGPAYYQQGIRLMKKMQPLRRAWLKTME